jgi:uncharacterized protein YaiI (UPF0178 family)
LVSTATPRFTVWIDADACPREVRDLVLRTAVRRDITAVFVANAFLALPRHDRIAFQLVPPGSDKADDHIVNKAGPLDLAVTADIPLASRLVEKGLTVIGTRGEEYTLENIGERLAFRDLMDNLRSAGLAAGGPRELTRSDLQRFANALDRFISKRRRIA